MPSAAPNIRMLRKARHTPQFAGGAAVKGRTVARTVIHLGLALLLGACAEVKLAAHTTKALMNRVEPPSRGTYKVGAPYRVDGVWYYPAENPDYDEVGIASWYGADFHGHATANGARFDMNALTAAHRTLPMPSTVRVVNLENGRALYLTVNDRGPFVRGRIIDVSRRAAQLLGFYEQGIARVRVQAVRPAAPAGPVQAVAVATEGAGRFYVQAGAFAAPENARRLGRRLSAFGAAEMRRVMIDGRAIYRVRLGPFATAAKAQALRRRISDSGIVGVRVVTD